MKLVLGVIAALGSWAFGASFLLALILAYLLEGLEDPRDHFLAGVGLMLLLVFFSSTFNWMFVLLALRQFGLAYKRSR